MSYHNHGTKAVVLVLLCKAIQAYGPPAEAWASRTIYQVFTDRFATDGDDKTCPNLQEYCGGTFSGITRHVDYIADLGFDAIWLSPVTEQTQGLTNEYPDGYHGYWPKNLYDINPHFGTDASLRQLVDTLHSKGIWVMLDIVPNHMGYHDGLHPFGNPEHFHDCDVCLEYCDINWNDEHSVEHCRLFNLPDLDQDNPFVAHELLQWMRWIRDTYNLDAFRVDAAKHIKNAFHMKLKNASEIFAIGEYAYEYPWDQMVRKIADSLNQGALHSSLSFPMYNALMAVFAQRTETMRRLSLMRTLHLEYLPNHYKLLGTFIESHDKPRFLHQQSDMKLYRNALAFTLLTEGIPIIYYGSEQGMIGMRDPMWSVDYYRDTELYIYLKKLIWVRKHYKIWTLPLFELYVDSSYYVFSRGPVVVVLTNTGMDRAKLGNITCDGKGTPEALHHTNLTSIFDAQDKLQIARDGSFMVHPDQTGDVQIYVARALAVAPAKL